MIWIETKTDAEARELQARRWGVRAEPTGSDLGFSVGDGSLYEAGVFWDDLNEKIKNHPDQRLAVAVKQMPLPAAFSEACVALRGLIRAARKDGIDYASELTQLHWFASIWSFHLPYSARLSTPGFNVFESIPFSVFMERMNVTWNVVGYEHLELLNKTDCKWMVEAWGEPEKHCSLNAEYNHIWVEYELKYERVLRDRDAALDQTLEDLPLEILERLP